MLQADPWIKDRMGAHTAHHAASGGCEAVMAVLEAFARAHTGPHPQPAHPTSHAPAWCARLYLTLALHAARVAYIRPPCTGRLHAA